MKTNKIISTIILVCFLFNTAVSDLAFGLATPSGLNDIVGIQHKDMGRIKLALENQLVALIHPSLAVNIGTFQTILKEQSAKESTIFQPADMQFFFREIKLTNAGLCVMVRLKDKYGSRTYYATFSLQKDENGGFPIMTYTEKQYKGTAGFTRGMPQTKAEDAKAIERYVQHEKGIDTIIRYAAEHGLIVKQNIDRAKFGKIIKDILKALKIKSNNTKGLKSIEERNVFFVKETTEIKQMLKDNPATVIDEFGNEHRIIARAHTSNNSIYLFLDEREVDVYLPKEQREFSHVEGENGDLLAELSKVPDTHKFEMVWNGRRTYTPQLLLHEIGVILGLPIKRVSKIWDDKSSEMGHYGWVINEIDKRLELIVFGKVTGEPNRETIGDELSLSIVDLDKNLTTRDYAAGKNKDTIVGPSASEEDYIMRKGSAYQEPVQAPAEPATPATEAATTAEPQASATGEMLVSPAIQQAQEVYNAQREALVTALDKTIQDDIAAAIAMTKEAGLQIPTHPNERYNLLVISDFFANGEIEEHRSRYGDRFDLDRISGATPEQFVNNILAKASGKETKTIALVSNDLPAKQLERLTKVGIRFIRVNTTDLQKAKADKDADRERFQVDTYAMMLLLRHIDNGITADSSIYRLLSFYLKSHFTLTDKIAVGDYIMAIANNDVSRLIKGCLLYRPAKAYDTPNYKNVAAALISA